MLRNSCHGDSSIATNSVRFDVAGSEAALSFLGGVTSSSGPLLRAAVRRPRWHVLFALLLMLAGSTFWSAPALWAQTAHAAAVDLGSIAVGNVAYATVTFTFDSGGQIGELTVLTLGAPNLDFQQALSGGT